MNCVGGIIVYVHCIANNVISASVFLSDDEFWICVYVLKPLLTLSNANNVLPQLIEQPTKRVTMIFDIFIWAEEKKAKQHFVKENCNFPAANILETHFKCSATNYNQIKSFRFLFQKYYQNSKRYKKIRTLFGKKANFWINVSLNCNKKKETIWFNECSFCFPGELCELFNILSYTQKKNLGKKK